MRLCKHHYGSWRNSGWKNEQVARVGGAVGLVNGVYRLVHQREQYELCYGVQDEFPLMQTWWKMLGVGPHRSQDLVHAFLRVTEEHGSILLEEQRVLNACVTCGHGTLEHDHVLCVPNLQDWHTCDG